MREFKSLNPKGLPEGFDLAIYSEEPVVDVKESKGKIVIDYAFPGFYLIDTIREVAGKKIDFKHVQIKSTGFYTESGKPLLPSFGRYVQIPENSDFKITIQKGQPIQFDDVLLSPAQTLLTDDPEQKHEFEFDQAFYSKDVLYPEEIVTVTGPFAVDQYHTLLIHVTPLQYNPAKKKIIAYGNITITIDLAEITGDEAKPVKSSYVDNPAAGNLVLNPGQKIAEKVGFGLHPVGPIQLGPEYLIIYAKVFEKAALRLADWKQHKGLLTEAILVDDIVAKNDPDYVKKLKAYIRKRRGYLFARLRYVLFLGDSDMILTEKDIASDYYYSTQYDPDPAKPNDLIFPWLSIGRIPVRPDVESPQASGDSKAQGIVDKIIAYERNPPADPAYYTRQAFAALFQQGANHKEYSCYLKTIEDIRAYIAWLGYATERIYVTDDPNLQWYCDGSPIPADVKAAMVPAATATQMLVDATTEGQLYLGQRDHGYPDGWYMPPFTTSDLDRVTGDMSSIFYSINCQTGNYLPVPTECFAEKLLSIKAGAPSLIAATMDSPTFLNNDLIRALYDATFGGVLPTFPGGTASYPLKNNRIGDVLNYAKSYLPVINVGNEQGVIYEWQIFHVIGDPTLEMWKALPKVVTMKARLIKTTLDVLLSTCPFGTVMTIWLYTGGLRSSSRMLKRIEPLSTHITIPLAGLVLIPMLPIVPRPYLTICLYAPEHRFTAVRVNIPLVKPPIP